MPACWIGTIHPTNFVNRVVSIVHSVTPAAHVHFGLRAYDDEGGPQSVKMRRTHREYMSSELPPKADLP